MDEQTLGTVVQEGCSFGASPRGGYRMASARGKELVMQVWTIEPLLREWIGFAKS